MKRKGYRNCDNNFFIDSIEQQFNFNLKDKYLKIDFIDKNRILPAPVERVNIYLQDKRLILNTFLVNGDLIYYYEKEWYYQGSIRDIMSPPMHIFKRFNFEKKDILLLKANNEAKPARKILFYTFKVLLFPLNGWLIFFPDILDTRSSIEKNIFVKIKKWDELPEPSEDDLYRKINSE